MTKKELQAELIRQLKSCDEWQKQNSDVDNAWTFIEGRKSGLKHALQLVERLEDGKKA